VGKEGPRHARRHARVREREKVVGRERRWSKQITGGVHGMDQVDERTMEKYEREAKAKHRESWKFAWCMDTTDEERAKGKTQECGRGSFETEQKNYTILDAPGHKNFVPHMIGGASQADVACLVISVRKGEFEAGFDRGGQSREHAVLAKTAGVKTLIIGINKMDDPSVCLEGGIWDEERYNEVKGILAPFLKQTGFNPADVHYMPISGFTGANLKTRVDLKICPWYNGPSLLEFLDNLQVCTCACVCVCVCVCSCAGGGWRGGVGRTPI